MIHAFFDHSAVPFVYGLLLFGRVPSLDLDVDTLYTFWDNTTHYRTKSVHILGHMNSATKKRATSPKPHTPKPSTMNGKPKADFRRKEI